MSRVGTGDLPVQPRLAAHGTLCTNLTGQTRRLLGGGQHFRHHLDIAVGSMAELSYVLVLARDLGYLPGEVFGEVEALRDHASRLKLGLVRCGEGPGQKLTK